MSEAAERAEKTVAAAYRRPDAPLLGYATLITTFTSLAGASLATAARRGRLPDRVGAADLLLLTVATHHLSRLLTKDKVTSIVRAPFALYEGRGAPGEVEESPRGSGMRLVAGELLTCPYCIGQWVAMTAVCGLFLAPRATRAAASILAVSFGSDVLQIAYRAAVDSMPDR